MSDSSGQHVRFFTALGEAVSTWAYVEGKLYDIVKSRLGAPDAQAAIVFGRTPQVSAHLALASELLAATLPPKHPSLRTWKNLAGRVTEALPIRNMLVHQPVHYGDARTISVRPDERGDHIIEITARRPADYAFGLSEVTQARKRPKLPNSLSADDIVAHLALVRQINLELAKFAEGLPRL